MASIARGQSIAQGQRVHRRRSSPSSPYTCRAPAAAQPLAYPSKVLFASGSWAAPCATRGGRTCAGSSAMDTSAKTDLLIVGPGVLGGLAGRQWAAKFQGANVVGQTNTTNNHATLRSLGIEPRTKEQAGSSKFSNVLFSAPPSGSGDYVAEIKAALDMWDKTGSFVFTSSAGVYSENAGGPVDETSAVVSRGSNPRMDRILDAEEAVLSEGGNVVRLVGLYHSSRGAHTAFLKMGQVARPGSYLVNLIHYEDAASIAVSALSHRGPDGVPLRGELLLGADGVPVTFRDMMDAVAKSGRFEGGVEFTEADEPQQGKRVGNEMTRKKLGWKPKYASFASFMEAGAEDVYSAEAEGLGALGMKHK